MAYLVSIAEDEADLKMFLNDLDGKECNHEQLYAHVTIDVTLPVEHNSAAEMTRVLDRISSVLRKSDLDNYRVRSGIEVDEDGTVDVH